VSIKEGEKSSPAGQYADLTPWFKNWYCELLEEDDDDDTLKKMVTRKTKIGVIMIFWTAMVYDHIYKIWMNLYVHIYREQVVTNISYFMWLVMLEIGILW